MSALPHETSPKAYADPYRLESHEGPQTLGELRAELAVIDPAELVAFNARHEAARFGGDQNRVVTEARHLIALRTRPEVQAAIAASLAGETDTQTFAELFASLDGATA